LFLVVIPDVRPHIIPKDLRRWAILRATDFYEFFTEVSFHADTETGIFSRHLKSVSIVVTIVKEECNLM
tara:strand:+ start:10705 stop:10911 length:207 start_codon:yes stop_codon:yes gene_type:complete